MSATSASASAMLTASTSRSVGTALGSSASRNRAAPEICIARPSGARANAAATSRPYNAASPNGRGNSPICGTTGSVPRNSVTAAAGNATPATKPASTPNAASAITCIRQVANTSRAEAPRQRSVAMPRARACSQARTPLATPMPPTSSDVRPTSVMNRLVRSTNCTTPGAASWASRMRQPVSGNAARNCFTTTAMSVPRGSAARRW